MTHSTRDLFALLALLPLLAACGGRDDRAARTDSMATSPASAAADPGRVTGSTTSSRGEGACRSGPITGYGVGVVRLGMKADSLRAACQGTVERREAADEGSTALVLDVLLGAGTAVAEIDVGQVWRIQVRAPGLRTEDGIGVGSALRELLTDDRATGMSGEGRLFVTSPSHCGLSFQLAPEAARALPQGGDAAALRRLPPETRITRILVVGCRKSAA